MKTVHCVIKGSSPLLINRFKEQDEITEAVKIAGKKNYGLPREQAELTAYTDNDKTKTLWVPSTWISGCIRAIASDYKLPGTRKSVKSVSGGAIVPLVEKLYFNEKYCLKDIEVDSRPVVIQRARIMRHRTRLEQWTLAFDLEIDDEIIPTDDVHLILNAAGRRAGIGDFRVNKGGLFGKFIVTTWKEIKERK